MGRAPCCDKANVKKGPWSPEEDLKLKEYIEKYGTGGNWIALPQKAGLKRCGKSCRLRWLNYLRPNIKHGEFTDEEDRIICGLFTSIGSRWSIIAAQLPGRTDNDIKNYWNTKLKKKLMAMAPQSHRKPPPPFPSSLQTPPLLSSHFSLSTSLYKDQLGFGGSFSYYPSCRSFTGFDPISAVPSSLLCSNSSTTLASSTSSLFQTHESLLSPMQYYQPVKDNLIMFGSEASCSSNSDGSCSQISYGKEIKREDMGFQSYISNAYEEDNTNNGNSQKFMLSYGDNSNNNGGESLNQWEAEKANGCGIGEPQLDYVLEEVKQLISSSSSSCNIINGGNSTNHNNNFLFIDENKTQQQEDQKIMYHYFPY